MMQPRFPKFETSEQAAQAGCFNCKEVLTGEIADCDFPDGSGRYGMHCVCCNMVTFFDLQPVAVQ